MAIVFNATTRKSISRRIVKIPIENTAFDTSIASVNAAQVAYGNVDSGNKLWFDWYGDDLGGNYEQERTLMNGYIFSSIIEQNLTDSANKTAYNFFFPLGENYNPYVYPIVNYMANGQNGTLFKTDGDAAGNFTTWEVNNLVVGQDIVVTDDDTGDTADTYIQNIVGASAPFTITVYNRTTGVAENLSNYTVEENAIIKSVREVSYEDTTMDLILEIYNVLLSGVAGGAASAGGGYNQGTQIVTASVNSWGIGQLVIGDDGAADGAVLEVISTSSGGGPYTYSVREVAATGTFAASFTGTFGGFTNLQRENLAGSAYDNALNALADKMKDWVYLDGTDDWQTFLTTINATLTANEEDRAAQQAQIAIAQADATAALLVNSNWQAFPDTGVTGKFSDGEIGTINTEITARKAFAAVRVPQIVTALGGVTDAGGSFTFLNAVGDIYYRRFQFADFRINITSGSLSKSLQQSGTVGIITGMKTTNTELESQYTDKMAATLFVINGQGSTLIEVTDSSSFVAGDVVYVISETQAEILTSIVSIKDNIVNLKDTVSVDYKVLDLARLYKEL